MGARSLLIQVGFSKHSPDFATPHPKTRPPWTPSVLPPCYSDQFGPREEDGFVGQGKEAKPPKVVRRWAFDKSLRRKHLRGSKTCGHTSQGVNFGFPVVIGRFGAVGSPRNICNLQVDRLVAVTVSSPSELSEYEVMSRGFGILVRRGAT